MARAKLAKKSETLRLKADGTLRLAVVADTHSAPHPDCERHLAALRPDAILHAGDIGDLEVLRRLEAVAPLHVVRGNIDARAFDLPDLLTLTLTQGERAVFRLLLLHLGVAGPRLRADAARRARAEGASLVVCGHSHVPFIGQEGGLTVFNPGSVGPRRFTLPIVFGTIDVGPGGVSLQHVDCETGRRWTP